MGRRSLLICLLLLASLGALAWGTGLFGAAVPEPQPPPRANGGDPPAEPPAAAPADPAAAPAAPAAVPDVPRVWVTATVLAALRPPHLPELVVERGGEPVPVDVQVVAGLGAGWPRGGPRGGAALLRIGRGDGELLRRADVVDANAPVVVRLGAEATVRGTVRDAAGKPVAGAAVWPGGGAALATDADGAYAATVPGGTGVPVVVRADGHASAHRFVDTAGGEVQADFVLAPGCTLTVQLTGDAAAVPDAEVHVLPGDEPTTEVLQFPWFLPGNAPRVGADGRLVVRGLPRGATVRVVARGPLLPTTPPREVALRGEAVQTSLPVTARAAVHEGRVVAEDGQPIEGALVHCWPARDEPEPRLADRWLLPLDLAAIGTTVATTRADGTFAIGAAPRSVLAVHAPGTAIAERAAGAPAAGLLLCLPPPREGPASLAVPSPAPDVPWGLRVEPWTDGFVAVAAGACGDVPLPGAFVLDLDVRVQRDATGFGAPHRLRAVAANGRVLLPASATAR